MPIAVSGFIDQDGFLQAYVGTDLLTKDKLVTLLVKAFSWRSFQPNQVKELTINLQSQKSVSSSGNTKRLF